MQTHALSFSALACAATLLIAATAHAADAPANTNLPPAEPIFKATEPPKIDGKLDDACWQKAKPYNVDFVHQTKPPRRAEKTPMTVKYSWDDHYLYIGYEVFDTNLVAVAKNEMQGPPTNRRQSLEIWKPDVKVDVVEFFLSMGDMRFFWEIHHNALNQFNDVWCVATDPSWPVNKSTMTFYGIMFLHQEFIADEGSYTLATGTQLKPKADGKPSTPNDESDIDTGYTGEIRIPWLGLGVPRDRQTTITRPNPDDPKRPFREPGPWKMQGFEFSALAVAQDGDLKDRYHRSGPYGKGGFFHEDAPSWPRFRCEP
jgi:hypothetical protein